MTKIIGLSLLFLFTGFGAFAQVETVSTSDAPTKKACCKQGKMTKADYKMDSRKCKKVCKSATAKMDNANEGGAVHQVSNYGTDNKTQATPKCQKNIKKCAKEMGMTEEECKARCKAAGKTHAKASLTSNEQK